MQVQQREGSIAMLRIHRSRRHFAVIAVAGSLAVGILGAGLFGSGFFAAGPALAVDPVFREDGLALHGYDPVPYLTNAKPLEGQAEFPHRSTGTVWRCANPTNRDAFPPNHHG